MSSGPPLPSAARSSNRLAKGAMAEPFGATSTQVFTLGRRGRIWATASRNSEA